MASHGIAYAISSSGSGNDRFSRCSEECDDELAEPADGSGTIMLPLVTAHAANCTQVAQKRIATSKDARNIINIAVKLTLLTFLFLIRMYIRRWGEVPDTPFEERTRFFSESRKVRTRNSHYEPRISCALARILQGGTAVRNGG